MLVTGNMPMMLAGFNFISYTLSVPVGMYFVERAGRRKLMLIGLLVMGGSLVVAGPLAKMAMSTPETEMTKKRAYGAAVAAFIFLYTCGFGSTWITCSYVFPPSSLIATPPAFFQSDLLLTSTTAGSILQRFSRSQPVQRASPWPWCHSPFGARSSIR